LLLSLFYAEFSCDHFGVSLALVRYNMALSKEVIRNLLLYEYQLGYDAQTAAANVNRTKGAKTSDYHLFRSLEHFLSEQRFRNIGHLRRELTVWFASKGREFYERGIDLLPERWQNTVDSNGEYFD
jgi:hypothetical protein